MTYPLVIGGAPAGSSAQRARTVLAAGMVIAVDRGAELALAVGRVPDLYVGDGDSITPEARERLRAEGVSSIDLDVEKDMSDLDAALDELARRGLTDVHLTAVTDGRLDHALVVIGGLFRHPELRPVLEEPGLGAWLLSGGHRERITVSGKERTFSVLAGPSGATVTVEGARWPLDRVHLEPLASHGLSNTVADAAASVIVHEGSVLVVVPTEP